MQTKEQTVAQMTDNPDSMPGDAATVATAKKPVRAGVVAVIGCDGSGKTRLATDIAAALRTRQPTRHRYMGLVSGETGDKIKRLPLVGVALERYLAIKVRRAQDMEKKLPGLFTAVIMYLFSLWRGWQMRRLGKLVKKNILVIAERYPQAEVPGFHYDGPGLAVDRSSNRWVQKLAAREQKLYEWLAEQKPDLVLRLLVDADTAYARKPDHPYEELSDKIKIMKNLDYNGAKIVEIDACMPYTEVRRSALEAIDTAMGIPLSGQD